MKFFLSGSFTVIAAVSVAVSVAVAVSGQFAVADGPSDSGSVAAEAAKCLEKADSNPAELACLQQAQKQLDPLVKENAARIKQDVFKGKDARGRDREQWRPSVDRQLKAFSGFQNSSAELAQLADGGTGSDVAVAGARVRYLLTLQELQQLEIIK